jgi:hypothetical protein
MHEIITVTKFGKGNPYYEVATTQRQDGTSGSLGAFTKELEALQYANRHSQQHRGAPHHAVLNLTDEQRHLLEHGTTVPAEAVSAAPEELDAEELHSAELHSGESQPEDLYRTAS